tara:strand:+ start:844 stop:1050 length:207 start_codon:yes stop_codon:yes gene_type:complete
MKKDKAKIVEELLGKGYITTEEAVVLLTNESNVGGITYVPYPTPQYPNPGISYPPNQPWYTTTDYKDK